MVGEEQEEVVLDVAETVVQKKAPSVPLIHFVFSLIRFGYLVDAGEKRLKRLGCEIFDSDWRLSHCLRHCHNHFPRYQCVLYSQEQPMSHRQSQDQS
jgi:hypothetical protein